MKTPQGQADELEDERLLVEAAQRDPSRFAELYERNFNRVYAYIARRVTTRADAEDLTSQVFHKALAGINRFEWRGAPFAAWLFRIAANAITDHAVRQSKEQNRPTAGEHSSAVSEETRIEEAERRAQLFGLVAGLPEDQRRVIRMRFGDEKSIHEIAIDLGRSDGAVKQLQFRALESLRARMGVANG